MKTFRTYLVVALALGLFAAIAGRAAAHPLPGQIPKFSQLPLNDALPPSTGGAPYPGHDNSSTAYTVTPQIGTYTGHFMADDFADNYNTPVVHVRWWGSYIGNQTFNGVQNFLISFESDMPFDPLVGGSRPDQPLLNQVVTKGAISPGSGTFSEALHNGNMNEHLYEYNAELAVPFQQMADTVYWLKIVALVDPATEGFIDWGWHNRDWGIQNTLASPNVSPGESIVGTVPDLNGMPTPVWHFQDDAVEGQVQVTINTTGTVGVQQSGYRSTNYIHIPGAVPIDGPPGIDTFSQDLAFELFTVPEPSTLAMLGTGVIGLGCVAWRRRKRK